MAEQKVASDALSRLRDHDRETTDQVSEASEAHTPPRMYSAAPCLVSPFFVTEDIFHVPFLPLACCRNSALCLIFLTWLRPASVSRSEDSSTYELLVRPKLELHLQNAHPHLSSPPYRN